MTTFKAIEARKTLFLYEVEWLPEDAPSFDTWFKCYVGASSYGEAADLIGGMPADIRSIRFMGSLLTDPGPGSVINTWPTEIVYGDAAQD